MKHNDGKLTVFVAPEDYISPFEPDGASQFKAPKRPEITRLPPYDDTETGPHTTVKALGKGSGKDGRP